jgi:hypothetical protein
MMYFGGCTRRRLTAICLSGGIALGAAAGRATAQQVMTPAALRSGTRQIAAQAGGVSCDNCSKNHTGQGAVIGFGVGAVGGALVGWLVSVDRWVTIPLR